MKGNSHRVVTEQAFDILASVDNQFPLYESKTTVVEESERTDYFLDMEFVNVQGGVGGGGRDNPHRDEWDVIDDQPHRSVFGRNFTAFNHFIDIKKGPGDFDDFDGYSYNKGSASKDQLQDADDAAEHWLVKLLSVVPGGDKKVDEGLAFYFADEYVHAPGQKWYRDDCSPAVARYSYFGDKGKYACVEEEAKRRFPLASAYMVPFTGSGGFPESVFMPVDNLARYWYAQYIRTNDALCFGPVMHAIQDVSIPHHTAGYCGNWHTTYEATLDAKISAWYEDQVFVSDVVALFHEWNRDAENPPEHLAVHNWDLVPARNWRVDWLATWLALNAYRAYVDTYNHFRNGFTFSDRNAKELTKKATAMCMLTLANVRRTAPTASWLEPVLSTMLSTTPTGSWLEPVLNVTMR